MKSDKTHNLLHMYTVIYTHTCTRMHKGGGGKTIYGVLYTALAVGGCSRRKAAHKELS